MKFAFSTVGCPQWDFPTIAAKAKEFGYNGVEIRGFVHEDPLTAANPFVGEPARVRETFASRGVAIACLSSAIAFSGEKQKDQQLAADLRRYIDTAQVLGCPLVRIQDTKTRPGQTPAERVIRLAQWLAPLVDYAAERQVILLVENALSFRRARDLWIILEAINHPALAAGWDVLNAALAGEMPAISVPVLNSRIQLVHVRDAILGKDNARLCKPGEGTVALKDLLNRLKGVGYGGWVSFEWAKAFFPTLAEPDEVLPQALAKLQEWTKPQAAAKPVKEPAKKATPQAAVAS